MAFRLGRDQPPNWKDINEALTPHKELLHSVYLSGNVVILSALREKGQDLSKISNLTIKDQSVKLAPYPFEKIHKMKRFTLHGVDVDVQLEWYACILSLSKAKIFEPAYVKVNGWHTRAITFLVHAEEAHKIPNTVVATFKNTKLTMRVTSLNRDFFKPKRALSPPFEPKQEILKEFKISSTCKTPTQSEAPQPAAAQSETSNLAHSQPDGEHHMEDGQASETPNPIQTEAPQPAAAHSQPDGEHQMEDVQASETPNPIPAAPKDKSAWARAPTPQDNGESSSSPQYPPITAEQQKARKQPSPTSTPLKEGEKLEFGHRAIVLKDSKPKKEKGQSKTPSTPTRKPILLPQSERAAHLPPPADSPAPPSPAKRGREDASPSLVGNTPDPKRFEESKGSPIHEALQRATNFISSLVSPPSTPPSRHPAKMVFTPIPGSRAYTITQHSSSSPAPAEPGFPVTSLGQAAAEGPPLSPNGV